MTKTMRLLVVIIASLAKANLDAESSPQAKLTTVERVTAAENSVASLQLWVSDIESRIGDRTVALDCDTGKFRYILPTSSSLAFLAFCKKLEPYLEGYRLTLSIGNPYSMHFGNLSGKLGYGDTELNSLTQTIPFSLPNALSPGIWTELQVVINPAQAKDMRKIYLRSLSIESAQGIR